MIIFRVELFETELSQQLLRLHLPLVTSLDAWNARFHMFLVWCRSLTLLISKRQQPSPTKTLPGGSLNWTQFSSRMGPYLETTPVRPTSFVSFCLCEMRSMSFTGKECIVFNITWKSFHLSAERGWNALWHILYLKQDIESYKLAERKNRKYYFFE